MLRGNLDQRGDLLNGGRWPTKSGRLLSQLKSVGLTAGEARAYLAVIKLGPARVLDIARESGLQRTQVYHLMQRLASMRLVEETIDRPKRYRPSSVQEGLRPLISYNATVVPPPTFPNSEPVIITEIRVAPTMPTAVDVAICTQRSEMAISVTSSITPPSETFYGWTVILILLVVTIALVVGALRRRTSQVLAIGDGHS